MKNIIKMYGPQIIDERKRFESVINDIIGPKQQVEKIDKEIFVLKTSLELKIPQDIIESEKRRTLDIDKNRYIERLTNNAIEKNMAEWIVKTWIYALGIYFEN